MFTGAWHPVKLHPFIQFEWPSWEFKLSWHSCPLHDHCIVLFIIHWLYKAATSIAAPFCQFYAYLSVFFVRLCFQFLDHCDKLIIYIYKFFTSWIGMETNVRKSSKKLFHVSISIWSLLLKLLQFIEVSPHSCFKYLGFLIKENVYKIQS